MCSAFQTFYGADHMTRASHKQVFILHRTIHLQVERKGGRKHREESKSVSPGDRKTVTDKTQHEYLAGKLKLQNTEKRPGKRKEIKYSRKHRWDKCPPLIPNSRIVMAPSLFSSSFQGTPFEYYGMQILCINKPVMNRSNAEVIERLGRCMFNGN